MRRGRIDHAEQERQAAALMERLQTGVDPRAHVEDLMIGQQQLVEIAKAVARNARILIMDEPTSALSAPEVEILFRVIADLKAKGVAIVYISHRLEELMRIGDYITVLRDGRVTGARPMADVDVPWIVRQMIGSDAKDFSTPGDHDFGGEVAARSRTSACRASPAATRSTMSRSRVRAGEILGVYGLMGAGRSEFLECVMGRHPHGDRAHFHRREGRCVSATSAAASPAASRLSPRTASATDWSDPLRRRKSRPWRAYASSRGRFTFPRARGRSGAARGARPVDQGRRSPRCPSPRCPAATSRRS